MPLQIALQMDPPERINYAKDSTYMLALEAQKRGHSLFYYNPSTLSLENGILRASCTEIKFSEDPNAPYSIHNFENINLTKFDIILMRHDFNDPLSYDAMTHLLDHVTDDVCVLNDPTGTRRTPEKISATYYPDFIPATLISRNLEDIKAFQKDIGDVVIKPLNGFGGMDIYHLKAIDDNLQAVFDMLCRLHSEPFIVQQYIPEIRDGDKRIIVVEGEPIAALLRVPAKDNARANLAAGGRAVIGEITERDREICAAVKPMLIERGLSFVGLDVIGDYLTEINPKSPTGLQQIKTLSGFDCAPVIFDAFEARYEAFKK